MSADLPRLLYIGDVPVEASSAGALQLHRLLQGYPADRLRIIETRDPVSRPELRLPGVTYAALPITRRRGLRPALRDAQTLWLSLTAPSHTSALLKLIPDYRPEAIVTITNGIGWRLAAAVAERLELPLHLIAHDDWPKLSRPDRFYAGWLHSSFAAAYKRAASRLCISPFMLEEFTLRYGVSGTVVSPCRSGAMTQTGHQTARAITSSGQMVVGYCGGSGEHEMPGLRALAAALGANARAVIYGPFSENKQRDLHAISPSMEFRGFVAHQEMMSGLRDAADVLFVPMAFDAAARANMRVSFPSKLVDYTALGLPMLIHAPADSSAMRWALMHEGVAETAGSEEPSSIVAALQRLTDTDHRGRLAARAREVGSTAFDPASVRAAFHAALVAHRPAN